MNDITRKSNQILRLSIVLGSNVPDLNSVAVGVVSKAL
jgi:hypothetical protein